MKEAKEDVLRLTGRGDKDKRRELDFYPTPPDATMALMEYLKLSPRRVWEPACGNGAMARVIEEYGHDVVASDLREDSGYGKGGVDYLETKLPEIDAIITNPPFNVSKDFIRKAVGECGLVAMLLKSQYWHAQDRLKLFREFPPAHVLPLTWRPDFLFQERSPGERAHPTMEVAWTVWIEGDRTTKYFPLARPKYIDKNKPQQIQIL